MFERLDEGSPVSVDGLTEIALSRASALLVDRVVSPDDPFLCTIASIPPVPVSDARGID
ncbi:MAG: hypothetical protein AAGA70_07300 [Pseudomonadota bacterium]